MSTTAYSSPLGMGFRARNPGNMRTPMIAKPTHGSAPTFFEAL